MNERTISVVIPVYNVDQYLEECIESVRRQKYHHLDIILVDDGSTDKCPAICDQAAFRDERIRVIHKKNGGLSDARNTGLKFAKGDYVTFLDSDDYIDEDFIMQIYTDMYACHADIGIADYCRFKDGSDPAEVHNADVISEYMLMDPVTCLKKMYQGKCHAMSFVAWGKIYRKTLFTDHNILYPVGKLHEDTFVTYRLLYEADRISYTDRMLYYYRERSGSIMQSGFNLKHLDATDATREACDFYYEHHENELMALATNYHIRLLFRNYYLMTQNYGIDSEELAGYRKALRRDVKKYLAVTSLPAMKKIVYYACAMRPFSIILKKVMIK